MKKYLIILFLFSGTLVFGQENNTIDYDINFDWLFRVADELNRKDAMLEQQKNLNKEINRSNFEANMENLREANNIKALNALKIGVASKINYLPDGTYNALDLDTETVKGHDYKSISNKSTQLFLKDNKVYKLTTTENDFYDTKKYCSDKLNKYISTNNHADLEDFLVCFKAFKMTINVEHNQGKNFYQTNFENGVITLVDIKSLDKQEFLLFEETVKTLNKK